jgi:ankyrin repeat protein
LKEKESINKYDSETPLIIASRKGYLEIVELLLKNRADINKSDQDGETPLHKACIGGPFRE